MVQFIISKHLTNDQIVKQLKIYFFPTVMMAFKSGRKDSNPRQNLEHQEMNIFRIT
jgi:hypothetical protein